MTFEIKLDYNGSKKEYLIKIREEEIRAYVEIPIPRDEMDDVMKSFQKVIDRVKERGI